MASIFGGHEGMDIMPRMQLVSLSMGSWVDTSKCLACIPFSSGIIVACLLLVFRGFYLLAEGADMENYLAEAKFKWGPPRVLLVGAGLGDLMCALASLVGLVEREAGTLMWLMLWPAFSVALLAVTLVCILGVGGELFANVESEWEIADMILFGLFTVGMPFAGFRLLLSATLRWTVEKSLTELISEAGRVAFARQDLTCDKRHVLAVLLHDQGFRNALRMGGCEVERMKDELTTPHDGIVHSDGEIQLGQEHFLDAVPLGVDAEELICAAARVQWAMAAEKLSVDHLVMALCEGGEINVYTGQTSDTFSHTAFVGYPLNSKAVRDHLTALSNQMDAGRLPPGPPGAPLFGCLPLEECVLAYTVGHCALSAGAIISIAVYGNGLGTLIGLKNMPEMQGMEFVIVTLGLLMGLLALNSILTHRQTRYMIRKAAHQATGVWDTDLRTTFDKVRGHPSAHLWRQRLFKAGHVLGLFTIWMPFQVIISLPVMLMYLADSNVCHAYWSGVAWVSNARVIPQAHFEAPLHCTGRDMLVLLACLAGTLFEMYICWGTIALWHEYAFGWTTTDTRGLVYVEPSAIPEGLSRKLAGISQQPTAKRGRPANVPATEATPLLL